MKDLDYLAHHGVKGMRWGVRKNENYSSDQRRRDKRIYGSTGVSRINRHMNKGDSVSAARSREADRINSTRRRARVAGQAGSIIGGVIGSLAGYKVVNGGITVGKRSVQFKADSFEEQILIGGAISAGAGLVGKQLGRYGGQAVGMLAGGYSPKKFR